MASTTDYLKLHFIVLLWGTTAILGKLISIPSVEMVFFRMMMAAVGMIVLVAISRGQFLVAKADLLKLLAIGFLVSAHWITFFASGKVSTVSVSLVGFATASFWTAIIDPISKKQSIQLLEILMGILVIAGLAIIYSFEFSYYLGLLLGVSSGLLLAIFAVINSHLVKRLPSATITLYEMIGGFIFAAAFLPIYKIYWAEGNELQLSPTPLDWIYIFILAIVCTVYAYSLGVELMKRISVFVFQLTLNLEPVYGILIAIIFLGEARHLNLPFYIGTTIILATVFLYPLLKKKHT